MREIWGECKDPSGRGGQGWITYCASFCASFIAGSRRAFLCVGDRAEQRLRMCRDGRGLGSNLVSFLKGFSKHPHILAIIKVVSEYSRLPFKLKVDYFILYLILVSTFVIFFLLSSWTKKDARKKRPRYKLACMTGALWAKRGEHDISRGPRHEREARDEGKGKIKRLFPVHCSCCSAHKY